MVNDDFLAVNDWTISSLLKETRVPAELAGHVRAQQLSSVEKLAAILILGNLTSALTVVASFWESGIQDMLACWGFIVILVSTVVTFGLVRGRRKNLPRSVRSRDSIERLARVAMVMGFVWGMAPLIVIPSTDPMGQMAVGMVVYSLMFAGALMLGRIPPAAFSFVLPLAICLIFSLQFTQDPRNDYLSVMTIVYVTFLSVGIRWSHHQFVQQLTNAAAVTQQSQLIGLLLRDFEESTSDWLWQTDDDGILVDIPLNLAGEKSQYDMMATDACLSELFMDGDALTILKTSLERHQSFRDLVLQVKTPDAERWWSVTGKPTYEGGFFAGFRGVASDVTASKETEDRIAYMAHYDGLTGLPNRATMHEELEKFTRKPYDPNVTRALLWLDLDNFKWVNDTLGHPAGDELLKIVSDRINKVATSEDTVARLGGDEFALIIERPVDGDHLVEFLDRLSATLARPYDLWDSTANCSASIGVRVFDENTKESSSLFKQADLALYHAKAQGRGTWCVFTDNLEDKARERREFEQDLQIALERNELRLHFQPLIDAKTRKVTACETLLRWQHPKRGMIMPGEFIEYAEDCGLITRLGDWVIRAAMEQAARLPEDVRVAINISPLQIHSSSLMTTVINALASNNIDPSRIELEITESVLMNDTEFTLERLHRLKELGLRIALDDFGTGFSSLSYLRSFPFDKIKIDKCFISDLETSEDNRAITEATLTLAKSLNLRCTAEGVETEFQSNYLRDHGCDELQGYLISRPQPLEKLGHLVSIDQKLTAVNDADGADRSKPVLMDKRTGTK